MLEVGKNDSKWFIDQVFYAESAGASATADPDDEVDERPLNQFPNRWQYGKGFGRGIFKIGSDKARMELAFSGIMPDSSVDPMHKDEPTQWSVGTSDNDSHDEQSFVTSHLKKHQRFRFVGDPENTIYTITKARGPYRRYNHTSYTEARGWNNLGAGGGNNLYTYANWEDFRHGPGGPLPLYPNIHQSCSQPWFLVNGKNFVWNNFLHPDNAIDINNPSGWAHSYPSQTPAQANPTNGDARTHPHFMLGGFDSVTWPQQDPIIYYDSGTGGGAHYNGPGNNSEVFLAPDNRRIFWKLDIEPNPLDPNSSGSTYNPIAPGNSSYNIATEIQFLESVSNFDKDNLSADPAVFETEPKDNVDLDIYYEASGNIPIYLHSKTNQDFAPIGSVVRSEQKWEQATPFSHPNGWVYTSGDPIIPYNPCPPGALGSCVDQVITVKSWSDNTVRLVDWNGNDFGGEYPPMENGFKLDSGGNEREVELRFYKPLLNPNEKNPPRLPLDDSWVSAKMDLDSTYHTNGWKGIDGKYTLKRNIAKNRVGLSWHNCYSFNNGVESDRIRDDFNATQLLNGVKASSVTLKEYKEEIRKNGLIYSGIYNSISETNNLNQFIMAEKITKDINPEYGSIQKLHTRDTDLVTICEDKVLKILANKDAVYNADGNMELTATANVLGQTIPFVGEYGISTNPESFASEAYRAYFVDKQRGAVLRLSRDGLTPISDYGMKAWFDSNLRIGNRILGSYDSVKREYNISIKTYVPMNDYIPGIIDWEDVPEPDDPLVNIETPPSSSSRVAIPPASPRNSMYRSTTSNNAGSSRIVSNDDDVSSEGSISSGY